MTPGPHPRPSPEQARGGSSGKWLSTIFRMLTMRCRHRHEPYFGARRRRVRDAASLENCSGAAELSGFGALFCLGALVYGLGIDDCAQLRLQRLERSRVSRIAREVINLDRVASQIEELGRHANVKNKLHVAIADHIARVFRPQAMVFGKP